MKSSAVSPSTGVPSGLRTTTVVTMSFVEARNVGGGACCWAIPMGTHSATTIAAHAPRRHRDTEFVFLRVFVAPWLVEVNSIRIAA
jgi:hypothetical protein